MTGCWWTFIEDDRPLLRTLQPAEAEGVLSVHGDPRVYTLDPHERHVDDRALGAGAGTTDMQMLRMRAPDRT